MAAASQASLKGEGASDARQPQRVRSTWILAVRERNRPITGALYSPPTSWERRSDETETSDRAR